MFEIIFSFSQFLQKAELEEAKQLINPEHYDLHFNYKLNPTTWNLLVNKQIYMKFEQLHIEKQLNERKRLENEHMNRIRDLEHELADVREKRARINKIDVRQRVKDDLYKEEHQRTQV